MTNMSASAPARPTTSGCGPIAPELTELIEEEGNAQRRLAGRGDDGIEGEADEAAHEAEAGSEPVGRDREIDGHRPPLQIPRARPKRAEPWVSRGGGAKRRAQRRPNRPGRRRRLVRP